MCPPSMGRKAGRQAGSMREGRPRDTKSAFNGVFKTLFNVFVGGVYILYGNVYSDGRAEKG